jgi:osmotically-inducible protein OsmY
VVAADVNSYNDMAITSQVQHKLQSDSQLMGSKISVETKNGEVTLKGMVNSEADITRAGKLASWVDGVKNVDNRLKREQASSSYGGMNHALGCPVGINFAC